MANLLDTQQHIVQEQYCPNSKEKQNFSHKMLS